LVKYIIWSITGAGAYLRDLAVFFEKYRLSRNVRITIALSRWGFEVSRIYGVLPILHRIAPDKYMEEFLVGDTGFYYVGRLNMHRYDVVVIAPATSNSVAKMVYGIADTLPTIIFAEAGKSGVPIIILPTDMPGSDGYVVSETPCYIDRVKCNCLETQGYCPAMNSCPVNAIIIVDGKPHIDLSKCIGCGVCVDKCINNAVKCWEPIRIKPRSIDVENIEKLKRFSNVYVVNSIDELGETLDSVLGFK
jgi:dihydromethanopterin reductase (acceptor)